MWSRSLRYLILPVFTAAIFLGLVQSVNACSCGPKPTVLDAFESSDEVVIVKVVSVEKVEDSKKEDFAHGVSSTTVVIERVFKGNLKVNEEIVFGQGGGSDCIWTFHEKLVGNQFLFYLRRLTADTPEKEPLPWIAFGCGRSNELEDASEDLLYLENLDKVRGKSRISGTLRGQWGKPAPEVGGKLVRIIGPDQKIHEVKTNERGVFEIYDLPAGNYFIEPEIADGWKLRANWWRTSASIKRHVVEIIAVNTDTQVPIVLADKRHAGVGIELIIQNSIRGRVLGPMAKPMKDICVRLLPLGKDDSDSSDCTNEQGRFEIAEIPEGEYVLAINKDDKPSDEEPFRRIFYPGVSDRERATTFNIRPGQTIENIDLVIPKLEETITVSGILRYSDGRPVVGESVVFTATKGNEKVNGDVQVTTDKRGRFTMKVLKGLTGELAGEEFFWREFYKNCPKVDELFAKTSADEVTVRSNAIVLTTQQNVYRVELTLPLPRCERID